MVALWFRWPAFLANRLLAFAAPRASLPAHTRCCQVRIELPLPKGCAGTGIATSLWLFMVTAMNAKRPRRTDSFFTAFALNVPTRLRRWF